jgi:hypothetical protein
MAPNLAALHNTIKIPAVTRTTEANASKVLFADKNAYLY